MWKHSWEAARGGLYLFHFFQEGSCNPSQAGGSSFYPKLFIYLEALGLAGMGFSLGTKILNSGSSD